jgi:hypothetical protein
MFKQLPAIVLIFIEVKRFEKEVLIVFIGAKML